MGGSRRMEQKCLPPANSNQNEDPGPPTSRQRTTAQPRSPKGRTRGEGGELLASRPPRSPPRGLGLTPWRRPSLGGMSHSHCERGRGTGERVGGPLAAAESQLFSGGDSGVVSPVAASLAPLRRRRRRARPGSPQCTARKERLLSRGEEESVGKGARGRRMNVRA